jgi:hypothetical protein
MNYRKIEKYSIISLMIVCGILLFVGKKYFLGLLLGGLASLLGLKIIERLENMDIVSHIQVKRKLRKNHLIRYLIYGVVLFASFIRPNVFSYITCFLGLLLTKIWIVIIETSDLKEA